jgi:hypothetical protein
MAVFDAKVRRSARPLLKKLLMALASEVPRASYLIAWESYQLLFNRYQHMLTYS